MVYRLTDPAFLNDPTAQLAQMRAEAPVVRVKVPVIGAVWVTTTDEASRRLLKSPDLFRRDPEPITGKTLSQRFWWMPASIKPMLNTMIIQDDPAHRRQRHLVELAFARSTIDELRPKITQMADDLLDPLGTGQQVNIVKTYTRRLPFLVICALLGITGEAQMRLTRAIAPLSHVNNALSAVYAVLRLRGALKELRGLIIAARNAPPGDGLISALVHVDDNGSRLSDQEILSMVLLLFLAGHETTVHLINNAIVAMAEAPELRAHFQSSPQTHYLLIEEFVRFYSPVMMTKAMFAVEDTDVLGAPIKKGEMVAAFLIGANHDPARVDHSATLEPTRKPNAHMGFGFGPHVCLGMQLARVETSIALERLFTRFPDLSLAEPSGWLKRPGIRAPKQVVLTL